VLHCRHWGFCFQSWYSRDRINRKSIIRLRGGDRSCQWSHVRGLRPKGCRRLCGHCWIILYFGRRGFRRRCFNSRFLLPFRRWDLFFSFSRHQCRKRWQVLQLDERWSWHGCHSRWSSLSKYEPRNLYSEYLCTGSNRSYCNLPWDGLRGQHPLLQICDQWLRRIRERSLLLRLCLQDSRYIRFGWWVLVDRYYSLFRQYCFSQWNLLPFSSGIRCPLF
jgi:hypothetical protein